jgi:hypothetical protein
MKRLATILPIIFFAWGCGNNPPNNSNPDHRLKFVGTYDMTKLENSQVYTMTIDTVGLYCFNASNCDSMEISNFADLFNIRFIQPQTDPSNLIYWPFYDPIIDKYGHRWNLSWGNNGPFPPTYYNTIYGDSIKISFRLDNILYYSADGVPYLDTIYTHVGVKQ